MEALMPWISPQENFNFGNFWYIPKKKVLLTQK